ncbi:hypothetical protein ACTJIJ_22990 [Niabella sp. 22666]|uniref:hypothetical protein n=1 Tax=Niabella sp. 22666 TaxID=3453954 RepID=UPI003F861CFC
MQTPNNQVPLINGRAYSWASVSVVLAGVPVIGITAISYGDLTEMENGYGAGQMPIDRGEGNYIPDAPKLTLRAGVVDSLQESAPNGRLQDLGVFDIIVMYLVGTTKKTHKVRNCQFTNNKRDIKQGDKIVNVELDLICSHVDWN